MAGRIQLAACASDCIHRGGPKIYLQFLLLLSFSVDDFLSVDDF
jgi:hypothetical protein